MKTYTKNDFLFEADTPVTGECENCGLITDNKDDLDMEVCPDCGCDLILSTKHEQCTCEFCGDRLGAFADAYRHKKVPHFVICEMCYEELIEGE